MDSLSCSDMSMAKLASQSAECFCASIAKIGETAASASESVFELSGSIISGILRMFTYTLSMARF